MKLDIRLGLSPADMLADLKAKTFNPKWQRRRHNVESMESHTNMDLGDYLIMRTLMGQDKRNRDIR